MPVWIRVVVIAAVVALELACIAKAATGVWPKAAVVIILLAAQFGIFRWFWRAGRRRS